MGLYNVTKWPSLTLELHPIHNCLVLTVSLCHQFYQQYSQGWHTWGLLSIRPILENTWKPLAIPIRCDLEKNINFGVRRAGWIEIIAPPL